MIDAVIERVRGVYGRWRRDTPVARMRQDWDALFESPSPEADIQQVSAGAVAGVWVSTVGSNRQRALLYFHGGGYKLGSTRSHADLMTRISTAAQCRVLGINYRLAPEHIFPAPVHDALAAYEWLLGAGFEPAGIALGGDSAGGGLAAALLLALRDRGVAMPAAAVLLSAWTDLTAQGASYATRAAQDPIHQRATIIGTARTYLGIHGNASDPMASPLFGDLRGLPPLLLQVGDRETVLDDSTRFAIKAREAGVDARLEIYDNMIHVFQQFAAELPEGREAIESIGRFLKDAWDRRS